MLHFFSSLFSKMKQFVVGPGTHFVMTKKNQRKETKRLLRLSKRVLT